MTTGPRVPLKKKGLSPAEIEAQKAAELRAINRQIALLERQQKILAAREDLLAFTQFTMPDPEDPDDVNKSAYQAAQFHREIAKALNEFERGDHRQLIFCMPPRHGKTEMATKRLAAWYMGRNPNHNVAVAAYSDTLAQEFGSDVRAVIGSPQYKQVFPDVKLRRGGNAKDNLETDRGGRAIFVGRGGALTGRGAHCFPAGTRVMTSIGEIPIERLSQYVGRIRVLSFDPVTGGPYYNMVEAFAERPAARLWRLTTARGLEVRATSDHKFWSGGAYVELSALTVGASLVTLDGADEVASVEATDDYETVYDIQVARHHNFFANGIGCSNCLIIDDLYKDHEEARSQAIRDQAWNWFTKVAMTRRMGKRLVIITMTRWHSDDIIGRITDPENPCYNEIEAKKWKIIRLPAVAEDDDPLGREPGQPLWPERYDMDFLLSQQRLDPLGFAALYQQRPTVADGILFRRETIQYYRRDQLPEELRVYAASDHAVGTGQRNDPSCFITVGVDRQSNIYVLDCWWERKPTDVAVEAMLDIARVRKPLLWWAERGHISKSIGPFLHKRMQETNTWVNIREVTPVADKQTRAQAIAARVAMGRVYFPKEAFWTEKAVNEMLAFPNGLHDDFVDCLAYVGLGLQSQVPAAAARAQKEGPPAFRTLAWVKYTEKWENKQRASRAAGGF